MREVSESGDDSIFAVFAPCSRVNIIISGTLVSGL